MFDREAETDSLERAAEPGPANDRDEAIRALKWIKEFCEAHHSGEPSGVHLHRLLVDIPHYLDYVIEALESPRSADAVDPHADSSTGKPDPRDPKSSKDLR